MGGGVPGIERRGVIVNFQGLVEIAHLVQGLAELGLELGHPGLQQGGGEHFGHAQVEAAVAEVIDGQAQVGFAQGGVDPDGLVPEGAGPFEVPESQAHEARQAQHVGVPGGESQGPLNGAPGLVELLRAQLDFGQIDVRLHKIGVASQGLFEVLAGLGEVEGGQLDQPHGKEGHGRGGIEGQGLIGLGQGRVFAVLGQIELGQQGMGQSQGRVPAAGLLQERDGPGRLPRGHFQEAPHGQEPRRRLRLAAGHDEAGTSLGNLSQVVKGQG